MKNKAIILSCYYNGLSIIQELGKHKIECIAMDCTRNIGTYSKFAKFVKCPDPSQDENKFVKFLYEFCKKEKLKPVLFPTNDHWATAISKYKKLLSEVSYPCVAEWEVIYPIIKKSKFYEMGNKNGWLTPVTWSLSQIDYIQDNDYPIVAKPEYRRISSDKNIKEIMENMDRLRLTIINNKEELKEFIKKESKYLDYLIFQEYVYGMSDSMYTVGIYANKDSEIIGLFTGRKVRGYPADIGDCIVGENYNVPEFIKSSVYKMVKDLHYNGIAEFEFKRDSENGKFRLIEVNPRSWSWIGITPACGVNLPLISYSDLIGLPIKPQIQDMPSSSIKYVKIFQDFYNCVFRYKTDYPEWHMSYLKWKKDISSNKVICAEWNYYDYKILVMTILHMIKRCIKKMIGR